jgi:two-component system sensor histidine kinase MprB
MSLGVRLAGAFIAMVFLVSVVFGAVGAVAAGSGVNQQVDRFLADRATDLLDGSRGRPTFEEMQEVAFESELIATDSGADQTGGTSDGDRKKKDHDQSNDDKSKSAFEPDAIVQVIGVDGEQRASTGPPLPVNSTDLELAASGGGAKYYRTVDLDDASYRVITAPIPEGGAIQVARELSESQNTIGLIRSQLLVAVPVVMLLAAASGILLARRITRPLRSLATSVDQVAATGNLEAAIDTSGDDEVSRVAAGFERLLRSLTQSRQQQQQLVQDAAHELRTPLTSIKANIDLLAAAPTIDPQARAETLRSAQRELRELSRLVDEVVDVASDRFGTPTAVPVELDGVVQEAVGRLATRAPDRTVMVRLVSVTVLGDADGLGRAVDNLLSNADKYSPADQPIDVALDAAGRLSVSDRGDGIDDADKPRVFDRFYRADVARSEPGSGLGLSIVAGIIHAHHGTYGVEDRPGGGTTVWFALPPQKIH